MIRPTVRFCVNGIATLVAVAAILFAGAAWRLSAGPIRLDFLTPYVQDALQRTDSPYHVEFSETVLTWAGWQRALDIRLRGVRAIGPDGAVAATASELAVSLSLQALWRGLIAPTEIEIIQPNVRVVRAADGGVELGFGDDGDVASDARSLFLADLLAAPDPRDPMGYLRRVSIVDADLVMVDRKHGMTWHMPRATIHLTRDAAGIAASAALTLDIAERTADVGVRARYISSNGALTVWLDFTDLRPAWFAAEFEGLASLATVSLPVSGSVRLALAPGMAVTQVAFDVRTGAGELVLDDWFDAPLDIASASAKGDFVLDSLSLRVEEASIDLGGPRIGVKGTIEGFGDSPLVDAEATVTELPVDDLARYWPASIAPNVRNWITENLSRGVIRRAHTSITLRDGDLALPRLPETALNGTLEVEGVTVRYLKTLPTVADVSGFATISGETFEMKTWGGTLYGLGVDESLIRIDDLTGDASMAIDLVVSGPVRDAMRVLEHPPLEYPRKLGVDVDRVGGTARTTLHFAFPLVSGLLIEDVAITVDSTLDDVRVEGAFGSLDIAGGPLVLSLDIDGMDLAGRITLNGVPGDVTWRENFTDGAPFDSRYTFGGRFDDAQRTALGLPDTEYVVGPAHIDVEVTARGQQPDVWRASADLSDSTLNIPEFRWSKAAGIGSLLELEMRDMADGTLLIDAFEIGAGDLAARGSAEIDGESGDIRRLSLDQLALGETDVRAEIVASDGGFAIALEGPQVDLRPFLAPGSDTAADNAAAAAPLIFSARVDHVITREGDGIDGVTALARFVDDRYVALEVEGRLATGAPLTALIDYTDKGRRLTATAGDAGALLRAFDVYDNVVGGKMTLRAIIDDTDPERPAKGGLRVENYKVLNAPGLAKVLTVASLSGIIDLLKGEGIPFISLVAPFTKRGDVLEMRNARSHGPAIGLTFKGSVDLATDEVDLNGAIVPAYTLNSALGNIPVLGDILVGEKGGGVFAINYAVKGSLGDPEVSVNPLSALAPGVLRKLFQPGDGDDDAFLDGEDPLDSSR